MGIFLNPGNEGFESAVKSQIYVDKTQMLAYTNSVLDSEQRYLCVSRPRRFGKSITAEMLTAYYGRGCDSLELFRNCRIASDSHFKEHLNRYDVIHIDINSFRRAGEPEESIVSRIQGALLGELRECYRECVPGDVVSLREALAGINNAKGTRFVVVIDEWDAVFREEKEDDGVQTEYIDFLRGLFKDAPSKKFIKLAYLTGILPIKKYGTESALNNFDEFTMLEADVLAEYVGFTEAEVRELCEKHGMDFERTAQWYDGYVVEKGLHVYNPKSVVDSIRRKRIGNYWTNTETYESLKSYISMNFDGLRDAVARMLAGDSCRINPAKFQNDMTSFKSRDDILTLLIHLGYLTYDRDTASVWIPNEEVKGEFVNAIEDAGWKLRMKRDRKRKRRVYMRKRIVIVLLAAVCILVAGLFVLSPFRFGTGIYIAADSPMILLDNGSGEPVVMHGGSRDYQTGDKVLILHNGTMMLSYPAQMSVYLCVRLKKGDARDVPQSVLDSLEEMGWLSGGELGQNQ